MKAKSVIAGLLSTAVCVSMLTACGGSTGTESQSKSDESGSTNEQSVSATSEAASGQAEESEKTEKSSVKTHKLYIRDSGKSAEMVATFLNSVSGKTEDVKMEKVDEGDNYFTYSCEGDVNAYNMVHLTYGGEPTMDVSFNEFVSGWYLTEDRLLPYSEGKEPVYAPKYESKTFKFDGYDKIVYFWTPDDYDANSAEKYSTIYMLDGQSVLDIGKEKGMDNDMECWNVSESVAGMMNVTDNKAIIVAIETVGDRSIPEDEVTKENMPASRDDELIPDIGKLAFEDKEDVPFETKKHGNLFADFICDTVMPYVQENYNVYTDAEHTSIAGSSLGGIESFYACLAHPDKFGAAGVLSATLGLYDEATWTAFLSDILKKDNLPFLYMYAGGYAVDNGDVTALMYNGLIKLGYPKDKIVFNKYEKGEHFISFWRNIYSEFLQAAFKKSVSGLESGTAIEYNDKTDPYEEMYKELSVAEDDSRPAEIRNYVYFDNSETKWDKVYAYWWGGKCINIITREMYGDEWPGFEMEKIEGTDIYRIAAPLGATGFIFSTGVKDIDVMKGVEAYQTVDLPYTNAIPGMVYKIDLSQEQKKGKGVEKTKYRYPGGDWTRYEG